MNKKIYLLGYLIPTIMFFFFIRNIILVQTENMDSWMGGGMRMFGKIDKMIYRVSGFNVNYNNKTYFVNLRNIPELEDEDVAARILPNDNRLADIIKKIKQYSWCYNADSDQIKLMGDDTSCLKEIDVKSITNFQVYRIKFQNESNNLHLELINQSND